MSFANGLKQSLTERLSFSTKLLLRRLLAESIGAGLRLFTTVSNFIERIRNFSDLDSARLRNRSEPFELPDFGARDLLFLKGILMPGTNAQKRESRIRVSIIIPVFNKAEFTFQCLRSLLREVDFAETEVIVVNNNSTDETGQLLSCFKDYIRVIENTENRGFVDACNQGAELARGEYLVFLNNDTFVLPDWLNPLVETAENDDSIGAVGSMFLYPDGRVQEAGAIVWKDGNSYHYGWGAAPDDRRFNFARDVDYCSGASLLIRTELFVKLGGFDRRFAPAYYEDVDICFGVRSLGKRVIYQPASRLIHYESITAGRDTQTGIKHFQITNRERFGSKWREVLDRENFENHPQNISAAANRKHGPNIVVFDDRVPAPDRDGGSARMFQILKSLARWSKPVFVSLRKPLPEYERLLWKEGVETRVAVDYAQLLKEREFAAAVLSRPEVAEAMLKRIRRANPRTRIIFDMVDAYFVRLQREYQLSGDEKVLKAAKRYEKLETKIARAVDQIWCASTEDKKAVAKRVPAEKIVVIPTIHALRPRMNGFEGRSGLLFVGNFFHRPNADGIEYFIREVFPRLRTLIPDIRLDIVGTSTPEINAYDCAEIRVRGHVPDITPLFHSSRVFVAPLRFGAGSKAKIGEALAHGLPVVTTSVGAESTGLRHGVDAMIADDPDDFAAAVKDLYLGEELWRQLADNGQEYVARNFTPEVIDHVLFNGLVKLNVPVA
jgi:GT2 family glycosyltransferase/glycosyltransferase involved in cell wall biosynthesis